MKKLLSKAMAVIMAAALCVGMCATAFAATASTDTGSITINDLSSGVTASAYQIAHATYDASGNFLGYEMNVSGTAFYIGKDGSYNESALTEENLAALFTALNDAAAPDTATVAGTATAGTNGTATITGLPVGSYLVVITGSTGEEAVAYGMMIGSVYYDTTGIVSGEIKNVLNCTLWAKSVTPSVEKTEHHTGGSDTHGESTNVGDEITFDITISNIPSYQGDHPEFEVDDTLKGLTISTDELNAITVKVMNGTETVATLVKNTDYTVTPVGEAPYTEFEVNFVVNEKYTLNNYANKGYTIVIEYPATVVDDGTYVNGEEEHDNDVVLKYSTTSYVTGSEGTDEDKDYEYDFDMYFTKTGDGGSSPLAGATFGLYTDSACNTPYTQNGTAVTDESDNDGKVKFSGLAAGTYYMKETKAPDGYLYNETVYTIVISASYKQDGSIDSWSITITADGSTVGSATNTDDTGMTIANIKGNQLPSTGGIGTTIFYVIGGVLVAGAVVVLVTRRRMNREA